MHCTERRHHVTVAIGASRGRRHRAWDVRPIDTVKKHVSRFFYVTCLAVLALVCFSALIGRVCIVTTEPLPIRVGNTLTNPLTFFSQMADSDIKSGHGLRDSYVMTPDAKTLFVYVRRFALSPDRVIASRSWTFYFDTNGTLISIDSSDPRWPIFGF